MKPSFITLVLFVALSLCSTGCKFQYNTEASAAEKTHLDTGKIVLKEFRDKYLHQVSVDTVLAHLTILGNDTLITKGGAARIIKNGYAYLPDLVDSVKRDKNKELFPHIAEKNKRDLQKPLIPVIISIILVAGVLGGLVRRWWNDMPDLITEAKGKAERLAKLASEQIVKLESKAESNDKLSKHQEEIRATSSSLQKTLSKMEDTAQKPPLASNVIFGIVASSLSFLALEIFDSRTLDFATTKDYFILWGWCVIGAVFAKEWIKSVYDRITSRGTSASAPTTPNDA